MYNIYIYNMYVSLEIIYLNYIAHYGCFKVINRYWQKVGQCHICMQWSCLVLFSDVAKNMSLPVTKDLILLDAFAGQGEVSKKYSQKPRIVASLPACEGGFSDFLSLDLPSTYEVWTYETRKSIVELKTMLLCKNINTWEFMHDTVIYCAFIIFYHATLSATLRWQWMENVRDPNITF